MRRPGIGAAAARTLAITLLGLPGMAHGQTVGRPPAGGPPAVPDQAARVLINRARVNGVTDLRVLVATEIGRTPEVLSAIEAHGGRLEARFDEVGYLRVRMRRDSVLALRALPGVVMIHPDGGGLASTNLDIDFATPEQRGSTASLEHWKQVRARMNRRLGDTLARPLLDARSFGADSPYVPWREMGVDALLARHPTFDGRGVTIAIAEEPLLDVTHPTLRHALTLAGDTVPKLAGIVDPQWGETPYARSYAGMPTEWPELDDGWVAREAEVTAAADGAFEWSGMRYRAPGPGRYALGHYRRGSVSYPVLWRGEERRAWLDTARAGDFGSATAVNDFNSRYSLGMLPPVRQGGPAVAFAVTIDSTGNGLRLYEAMLKHPTMTASVAAGHNLLGGVLGGVAPAARIVAVTGGGRTAAGVIEAYFRAARRPDVDILVSEGVGLISFPGLGEGFGSLMLDRTARAYGKPILVAAGNGGPMLGLVDPGQGAGVLAVGAYSSAATLATQYGWRLDSIGKDHVAPFSSWGPAGTGAVKPDFVASYNGVAAAPCGEERGAPFTPGYRLPACYALGNGTSAATPAAAGVAALLTSGAKQTGMPLDPARLAWALRGSARHLAGWPAIAQGTGVLQAGAAWELLASATAVPEIVVEGRVTHPRSRFTQRPGAGEGIFEAEGWTPGDRATKALTLTRRSGPPGPIRYPLRWLGNDGTYAAGPAVALPLGERVRIPVTIHPVTDGVHSATLVVLDPASGVPIRHIGATVVAARSLTDRNDFTVSDSTAVSFPLTRLRYVRVPRDVGALRVTMRTVDGNVRVGVRGPLSSTQLGSIPLWAPYLEPADRELLEPGSSIGLIARPAAGLWELVTSPYTWNGLLAGAFGARVAPARYVLTTEALRAELRAAPAADTPSRDARPIAVEVRNTGARLEAARLVTEIGRARSVAGRVGGAGDSIPLIAIHVDSGASTLWVRGGTSTPGAELFLYLYECAGERCRLWNLANDDAATKELVVRNPKPGTWKVLLDPVAVPAGGAEYEYTGIVTQRGEIYRTGGAVYGGTPPTPRRPGERWRDTVRRPSSCGTRGKERSVAVVELRDEGAAEAERAHPLGEWLAPSQTRPVAIARTAVELPPCGQRGN